MTLRVNRLAGFGQNKAGSLPWSPTQLPNLQFWYDPSDLSTLFQNSGGTGAVAADGDPVGFVADKSSHTRTIIQATAGARPLYKTSGGLSWLEFFGTDDKLTRSEVNIPVGTAIVGAYVGSTSPLFVGLLTNLTDQAADVDLAFTDGGVGGILGTWDSGQFPGSDLFDGTRCWNNKVNSLAISLDAVKVYSGDGTNFVGGTLQFPDGITVGADRSNGRFLVGRVYGVIMCSGILSDVDRNLAESWMGDRCGLSI